MSGPDSIHDDRPRVPSPRASLRRKRAIAWSAAGLGLLIAIVSIKPAFHWVKAVRARQIAAAAGELTAAGKWEEAAKKYRAALHLDPAGYEPLRGAAQLASRLGRPEAVDLWEQTVKSARATTGDWQEYAAQLVTAGRSRAASTVIQKLLKVAPDSRSLELASRYAQSVGEKEKAIEFARLAVEKSPNEDFFRFQLAELLAQSGRTEAQSEARGILWELAEREGKWRRPSVRALAKAPGLNDRERQRLIEMLGSKGEAEFRDTLSAADLQLQLHPDREQEIYEKIVSGWSRLNPSDRIDLVRWLNVHQQAERVLALVPLPAALKDNQLLLGRLDALAALQRWNDIEQILGRTDLTLDPAVLECFRARVSAEQNAVLDAELHWNHAAAFAAGDPLKLRFLAGFAEQSRAFAVALKSYEQLSKFPEHAAFAYRAMERLSAGQGDLSVQRAAARKIAALAPDDPNPTAQILYLDLLANREVESNTAAAGKLVKKYPDRLSFRVTAALGYLRQNNPAGALAQFKGPPGAPPIDWGKTPPAWRAVYAAALLAADQPRPAERIINSIPMDQLNPEERALIRPDKAVP